MFFAFTHPDHPCYTYNSITYSLSPRLPYHTHTKPFPFLKSPLSSDNAQTNQKFNPRGLSAQFSGGYAGYDGKVCQLLERGLSKMYL